MKHRDTMAAAFSPARVLTSPPGKTDFLARLASGAALAHFRTDRSGTTAVEFGLIAVPFLGTLMATIELGLRLLIANNLEAAVTDASRAILTGTVQTTGVTTASSFRTTYICPSTGKRLLGSFIDCSKLIIDVRVSSAFSASDVSRNFYKTGSTNTFCPGQPNTITVVRVAYPMPSFLPILTFSQGTSVGVNTTGLVNDVPGNPGWKHLLVSTEVLETENYPTGNMQMAQGC